MKQHLTPETIMANWDKFKQNIELYITGERQKKLMSMYMSFEDRIIMYPASMYEHHHSAFPGGYIDHVNRVVEYVQLVHRLWNHVQIPTTYSAEEMIFAAINHDLGKLGTQTDETYLPNDSKWHIENQGAFYKVNPKVPFMMVPDRSLFLLQQHGVEMSETEYFAIKLHDGLYDDANVPYYKTFNKDAKLRSNLPLVLHYADHMAAIYEYHHFYKNKK